MGIGNWGDRVVVRASGGARGVKRLRETRERGVSEIFREAAYHLKVNTVEASTRNRAGWVALSVTPDKKVINNIAGRPADELNVLSVVISCDFGAGYNLKLRRKTADIKTIADLNPGPITVAFREGRCVC